MEKLLEKEEKLNITTFFNTHKKLVVILSIVLVLILAVAVVFIILPANEEPYTIIAREYVEKYISDEVQDQYNLLDASILYNNKNQVTEKVKGYKRKSLMRNKTSYTLKMSKQADSKTLLKMNNIYKALGSTVENTNLLKAKDAYRFNATITEISPAKKITKASFWVVKIDNKWQVCTIFEYDRLFDRCVAFDLY